jgi:hypothetical protein
MAKPKRAKSPPPDEDEAQSQRFIEAANAVEADGGLSPTEAEAAFEGAMRRIAPPHPQPSD